MAHKKKVVPSAAGPFFVAVVEPGLVKQQFIPISDRPEMRVKVQVPEALNWNA